MRRRSSRLALALDPGDLAAGPLGRPPGGAFGVGGPAPSHSSQIVIDIGKFCDYKGFGCGNVEADTWDAGDETLQ